MDSGMKKKEKGMLMGTSSLAGREMDIGRLIKRTKEIDCRNTVFIDRADIIPDPENEKRFPQVDIEELSEWIYFRKKLYHDLIVVPDEVTGKYMLVDGERRYRAIMLLDDRQYAEVFPVGVNCCVFPAATDSTLLRLDSTLANYLQRHTDVYLRRQEILDLYGCLTDLRERNLADGDVISHMSDILGMKEKQLKRYINTGQLIPEFDGLLKDGRITIKEADRIASLDSDSQMSLYEKKSEKGGITLADIRDAECADGIKKAEKELAAISGSIDRHKELCGAEAEKARILAENTNDREKIRRQEKKVQRAEQKLEREESRYSSAAEALEKARLIQVSVSASKDTGNQIQRSGHDVESALSDIESGLRQIEACPELVIKDAILLEKLKGINSRLSVLLENSCKLQASGKPDNNKRTGR